MVEEYADLQAARRLLPEGSRVRGQVASIPQPGVIGIFVSLPNGLQGFVDSQLLPHDADAWPAVGMTTEFEVLQHRRRQVRLWPLDPRWRSSWARGSAQGWNEAEKRHPVGSVISATVTGVFPANQEYVIRFSGDKDDQLWSGATLSWVGDSPRHWHDCPVPDHGASGYNAKNHGGPCLAAALPLHRSGVPSLT